MHRLGDILGRVVAGQIDSRKIEEARIRDALKDLLGAHLWSAVDGVEVRGGSVQITTQDPAFAHQLRLESASLAQRLMASHESRSSQLTLKVRVGTQSRPRR